MPQYAASAHELDELDLVASGSLPGPVRWATEDVAVIDPEGAPVADLIDGKVANWTGFVHRPFHRLYLTPTQTRERYEGRPFVPVCAPLSEAQLRELALIKDAVVLALVGTGTATVPTIRRLASLAPHTLGIMHGAAYAGDGAAALEALADDYDRRFQASITAAEGGAR